MSKLSEKIFKAWTKWGNNYYKEGELENKEETDPYESVVDRTKEPELYAIEIFHGMRHEEKCSIISTPFYELTTNLIHRLNIPKFETKLSTEKFLKDCWKSYEDKVENNRNSARMLELLSTSNPDGARKYLINIPVGLLFECDLFKKTGYLKTGELERMNKFCQKLLQLHVIYMKENDEIQQRTKKREELLKMKELFQRNYMLPFSLEYEECMNVEKHNLPIRKAIYQIQEAEKHCSKAQEELDEKSIQLKMKEELDKVISMRKEKSRDFQSYVSRTKFKYDEIMDQIDYLFNESSNVDEMISLIPLNRVCRLCKKYDYPAIPEILLERHKRDVIKMLSESYKELVFSSVSSAYGCLVRASDCIGPNSKDVNPVISNDEGCIRFKHIISRKPIFIEDSKESEEEQSEEQSNKKARKGDDTIQLIDTLLGESCDIDAYFVAYLMICQINKCKSMKDVENLIKGKDAFFSDKNKSIYLNHKLQDIVRTLESIDLQEIENKAVFKVHLDKYRSSVHRFKEVFEELVEDYSGRIKSQKEREAIPKNRDVLIVPFDKLQEWTNILRGYIPVIEKAIAEENMQADLKSSHLSTLTFVKSFISKKEKYMNTPIRDVWKVTIDLMKICISAGL